jgi:DNA end-binding protein Ku
MKALWKGYITLGRLGIPVRLYAATQDSGVQFVQLHGVDNSPVERPLFCRQEHREIPYDEVVRAVEVDGNYVTFTDQELERTQETAVKAVVVRQFCAPTQLPLTHFEKPYYVVPTKGGERAYVLLREGLARAAMVAVGQFYFYGNAYVGALEAKEDMLLLHRLRFTDELVPRASIATPPLPRVQPDELRMLQDVIERYSGPVHLRDYHNEYQEYVQALCERKAKGLPLPRPERVAAHATPESEIPAVLGQMMDRLSEGSEGVRRMGPGQRIRGSL